jgi:hypothetical protein
VSDTATRLIIEVSVLHSKQYNLKFRLDFAFNYSLWVDFMVSIKTKAYSSDFNFEFNVN